MQRIPSQTCTGGQRSETHLRISCQILQSVYKLWINRGRIKVEFDMNTVKRKSEVGWKCIAVWGKQHSTLPNPYHITPILWPFLQGSNGYDSEGPGHRFKTHMVYCCFARSAILVLVNPGARSDPATDAIALMFSLGIPGPSVMRERKE